MSTGALVFMALSWGFVLSLIVWSYSRILRRKRHFDPDGIGPLLPPERAKYQGLPPRSGGPPS